MIRDQGRVKIVIRPVCLRWRVLGGVFLGVAVLILAVALRSYANDDPYITYRYAHNLARGAGLVFNKDLNVLSTTTPLYTFLLVPVVYLAPDLPAFSNSLSALSLGLTAILLFNMATDRGNELAGWVAGLLTIFFPLILTSFGAETAFYILLIVAALFLYGRDRLDLAATVAGLAALTRGDGALIALALAIHYVWNRHKLPWRPFFLYLVVVAPWYLYSWRHFGSPFPATLQAKLHQSDMSVTMGFIDGVLHWAKIYARRPVYWLYLPLILAGAVAAVRKHRWTLPLLLWAVLYFAGYSILNVPRYHWYYSPLIPPLMLLIGLAVSELSELGFADSRHRVIIGLVLSVVLVWPSLQAFGNLVKNSPDGRAQIYTQAGEWLKQNTPSEATVGTLEVGILGYFSERSIVDFAGLIQPDISRQVASGYENAAIWAIEAYRPDYLIFHPEWFPNLIALSWFPDRYQLIEQFENERYASSPLNVYAQKQ
jgi:hypothetical protein